MRTATVITLVVLLVATTWRTASTQQTALQVSDPSAAANPSALQNLPPLDRPIAPQPLGRIEPGTRVGAGPPAGWARLIMKSRPKATSGDVDQVAAATLDLVKKYFTAVLVGVEADPAQPGRARLGNVAIGLGTTVGAEDVILSKERASDVGVQLGMLEGMVLRESEKNLDKIVVVTRSSSMAVVDFPSILLRGKDHVESILRHAYLVDPRDGGVYALLWVLDKAPDGYRFSGDALLLLTPNQVVDCELHVDATKFFLGTPGPDAFAASNLPQGKPVAVFEPLKAAAATSQFTPNLAHQLELRLWDVLFPTEP